MKKHTEKNEELRKNHEQEKTQMQLDFSNKFNELIQTKKEELEAVNDRLAQDKQQLEQALDAKISDLQQQHVNEKLQMNSELESKTAQQKKEIDELKDSYQKMQEELE